MGTKLSGEFEGLDQAFQFRLAPVPHGLCQLHRAFRDTGPVGAFVVQRVRKFHPAIFFSVFQCVPQFIISHCRFSFCCDDVCSGTSPRQRHLPVFSQSVCREFVWEQRIRPGSLCRASAVCFICLCSIPCVGDSINPFSHHVNGFILSKTNLPFRQPVAHCRSPLNFIRPASFSALQSDTGASLYSFCRTRWLL